jgi:hypothetical protein
VDVGKHRGRRGAFGILYHEGMTAHILDHHSLGNKEKSYCTVLPLYAVRSLSLSLTLSRGQRRIGGFGGRVEMNRTRGMLSPDRWVWGRDELDSPPITDI